MPEASDHTLHVSTEALSRFMADLGEHVRLVDALAPWQRLTEVRAPGIDLSERAENIRAAHNATAGALDSTVQVTGHHHSGYQSSDEDNAAAINAASINL